MTATPQGRYDWDSPETAQEYARFCERHDRYAHASRELARHAALTRGVHVLDAGAGLGHTTEAALAQGEPCGTLCAYEPSAAMRMSGSVRVRDPRVRWIADDPAGHGPYDRILVGAALWLMTPLDATLARFASWLVPGGALCFTIPSLYLREPDEPGGGDDPHLHHLAARLAALSDPPNTPTEVPPPLPDAAGMEALLLACGLRPHRWGFRYRLTQAEYADWLKLPVLTERLMPGVPAPERAARIDAAVATLDPLAWKWEGWTGWTAWK